MGILRRREKSVVHVQGSLKHQHSPRGGWRHGSPPESCLVRPPSCRSSSPSVSQEPACDDAGELRPPEEGQSDREHGERRLRCSSAFSVAPPTDEIASVFPYHQGYARTCSPGPTAGATTHPKHEPSKPVHSVREARHRPFWHTRYTRRCTRRRSRLSPPNK